MQLLDYGNEFVIGSSGGWVIDRRCPHLVNHDPHYWKLETTDKHKVYFCPGFPVPENYKGAGIHHA